MNRFAIVLALLSAVPCLWAAPPTGYTLIWQDEFNGPEGTAPDPKHWVYDLGGGGWGNEELESYTDSRQNSRMDGQGHLILEAREQATKGKDGIPRDYSSARLKTLGRFSFTYGFVEASLKLPVGKGIWPAFWTLGADFPTVDWPACGEIDVMENLGHDMHTSYGTLHGPGYSDDDGISKRFTLPAGQSFSSGFHTFAVEWTPQSIRWMVDGQTYHQVKRADLKGKVWAFDKPHFLLLNLAVGGDWPGEPNDSTHFPQRLLADYVRVYRKAP